MKLVNQVNGLLNRAKLLACASVVAYALCGWASAMANPVPLPPQTNIRITIVQWIATKGEYQKWDVLGGDYQIADNGTISLPLLGAISVGDHDPAALAAEIATRLKDKVGLVQVPEATVAIINYPPIYVVGDVKTPGEYRFSAGLTVLQSLAMSGGEFREDKAANTDQAGLVGLLQELDDSILRGKIRIARLSAEASGDKQIHFEPSAGQTASVAASILEQEKAIFLARANLLERQSKSYSELRDLLAGEIENLNKKELGADADIASVEKELRNVKAMVEKGIALPSRQGDLERMMRSYYAGRLDLTTAVMRARQGISEASRNLEGLHDRQQSDVATELQAEQAKLDELMIKRETTQRQLLDSLSQSAGQEGPGNPISLTFSINRRVNGNIEQLVASENTLLQPGDVVRVTRSLAGMPEPSSSDKTSSLTSDQQAGTDQ